MFSVTQTDNVLDYKIKRFTNAKNKDYLEAVNIYLTYTPPALRTDTNQIAYWLEQLKNDNERIMYVLGYYLNNRVVGFCQFMYLKSKKIIIVDYMAIDKSYRKLGAFYQFIDLIQEFIEKNRLAYDYLITEIGFLSHNNEPCAESKALIRLLKASGLGTLCGSYFQPQLDTDNFESSMKAQLFIYSQNGLKEIKKSTYLFIIESIYFDHYLEWYIPFQTENEKKQYKQHLTKLLKKIENATHAQINIDFSSNEGLIQKKQILSIGISPHLGTISTIVSFILLIIIFAIVLKITELTSIELILVFLVCLFCVFSVLTLINCKAHKTLKLITGMIKMFFGKLK